MAAGVKQTIEPPKGIKTNLKRSWTAIKENFLD